MTGTVRIKATMLLKKIPSFISSSRLLRPVGKVIELLLTFSVCLGKAGREIWSAAKRARQPHRRHLAPTSVCPGHSFASPEHLDPAGPRSQLSAAPDR